jgi:PAS domain S-box-containing protein
MDEILNILQQTADGAYIIDSEQRIIFWNAAAESLLGYSAERVIGRLCYEIVVGRDDTNCPICRRDCVPFVSSTRREPVPNFDTRFRTADGGQRWVNVSIIAVPGENDTPRGVIHLFRDVEVKKQAQMFAQEVAAQAQRLQLQERVVIAGGGEEARPDKLTRRELQVLKLLAQGADTGTIATELIITESTVRNHVQRVLHKLGVHSRLEAAAYARENGLV